MRKLYKCQCSSSTQCETVIHGITKPLNCVFFKDKTPDWTFISDLPDNAETLQPDLPDNAETLQPDLPDKQDTTLPGWCKVGEWVYHDSDGYYYEVKSIDIKNDDIQISDNTKEYDYTALEINTFFSPARLRSYNDEEMKTLVGKILVNKENKDIHLVTDYINEVDEDDADYHYCTVYVGGENLVAIELLEDYTIDNTPCGVLKHLENGEWVK